MQYSVVQMRIFEMVRELIIMRLPQYLVKVRDILSSKLRFHFDLTLHFKFHNMQ
jgi:hypothetical protein